MTEQNVKIEEFFNSLLDEGYEIEYYKDYERINLKDKNIQILTQGNKYVGLNYLSRHKTKKLTKRKQFFIFIPPFLFCFL